MKTITTSITISKCAGGIAGIPLSAPRITGASGAPPRTAGDLAREAGTGAYWSHHDLRYQLRGSSMSHERRMALQAASTAATKAWRAAKKAQDLVAIAEATP
jgi:hypothetical protein